MKFTVNTDDFKKALEKVSKVTGVKTSETLENVRIRKTDFDVHLLATNLNQFIDLVIKSDDSGDVEFQFSDTRSILKAIKFFKGYQIEFDCGEYEVTMSCSGKKAKQRLLVANFPDFPTLEGEIHNEFEYDGKKLKERFNAVKYAVSTEKNRGVLTGICFRDNDMTASDGFRIAINKDESLNVVKSFVVPLAALKNITEIMNGQVKITTNGKFMKIIDDNAIFITRLIGGEYMNYLQYFTNNYDKSVVVDIKDFENGLKYLKTFITSKGKEGVHWCDNKLGVKNMGGYFESEVNVDGVMNMEISFNGDHMLEALSQFNKKVTIQLSTNITPMLISSEEDKSNIALVLPVRLNQNLFETAA